MISQESVSLVWSSFCSAAYWEPQVYSTIWNVLNHKESCFIQYSFLSQFWFTDDQEFDFDQKMIITDNYWQSDCLRIYSIRFRHPRPIDSWEGVKETKNLPNSCIQVAQCPSPTNTICYWHNVLITHSCAIFLWCLGFKISFSWAIN